MKQFLPKFIFGFLMLFCVSGIAWAQNSPSYAYEETFENLALTGSTYRDGSFVGNAGITWTYTHVTGEQAFPINAEGLLLRRSGESSGIKSNPISGGISNFRVLMRKAFTSSGDRQVGLFINNQLIAESQVFGNFTGGSDEIFTFEVENINIPGDFTLEIRHLLGGTTNRQLVIDNIAWNSSDGTQVEKAGFPAFSPEAGEFTTAQMVSIASSTADASIYYTLDGAVPNESSTLYTAPIEINTSLTIKAIAMKVDLENSDVAEASFVINIPEGSVTGLPYQQDFSAFINQVSPVATFGENQEWTFTGNILNYNGDFGAGTAGGIRGNGVLGYQHTGTSGVFTASLLLTNTSSNTIEELQVSYLGKVERVTQTRFPEFTVRVNGIVIPELAYSTGEGQDRVVSHLITGLSIQPGANIEISWASERGINDGGSSRQIGLTAVQVAGLFVEEPIVNTENFDLITVGTGYVTGSFVGNQGITWSYLASRNEGDFPIEGKGLMLRRASDNSSIVSQTLSGGIGSFSVDFRKAFTGSVPRQLALFINGVEIDRSEIFGNASGADATIRKFVVNDINLGGDIVIEIKNLTEGQITIDNIQWTPFDDNFAPMIAAVSPSSGAEEINIGTDLEITFDEKIIKGQGNIFLYKSDGTLARTIAVTDAAVTINQNSVSIALEELEAATSYYVLIEAGAFVDLFNNAFGGIQASTEWTFSTFDPNAPVLAVNKTSLEDFGRIRNGQTTDFQTVVLSVTNVTSEIKVTAPANFEVSTATGEFTSELILDPATFENGEIELRIRFAPTSGTNSIFERNLTFQSEGSVSRVVSLKGEEIGNQVSIAEARLLPNGAEVFVEGIVVAGSTLNPDNRWIQDATGGILLRAFANTFDNGIAGSAALNVGDMVRVSGVLGTFNQNIQISVGPFSIERLAANVALPEPLPIGIAEISNPANQGRLVRVNNIALADSRILFEGAGAVGSYAIAGQSADRIFRIPTANHPLVGTPIPDKSFDMIGIVDRFNATAQFNPRFASDLITENAAGTIVFSAETLDFGVTPSGQISENASYTFTVNQPSASIELGVEGPFEISLDGENFVKTLTLPNLSAASTDILVRFVPTAFANGIRNGFIVHTGEQIYRSIVKLKGIESGNTTAIPYTQSFNTPDLFSTQGWTDFNARGAQNWLITAAGTGLNNVGSAVQMNGFSNGAQDNENWLISPLFDLSTDQFPVLSFYSRAFFSGPRLRLVASSNYDGFSDPNSPEFTWLGLEDKFAVSTGSYVLADNIDLTDFKNGQLHLAFIYTSDEEVGAAEWRVEDFNIRIQAEQPRNLILAVGPLSNMHFGVINAGDISPAKSYNFTATGFTDAVTLSIDAPFVISRDGITFGQEIVFEPGDQFRSAIQVKYAPTMVGVDVASLKLTTAGETVEYGRFTGSTKGKENTFDVVTWNIEWFGSTTPFQGPNNVDLQLQNVKTIIEDLDADVYAFQEITNLGKFYELVAALPGYRGFHSPAVSQVGEFSEAQKLTYLYKTATVDSVSTRVLLQGVDVANLSNYPSSRDRFWASGRLPFLFDIKTNINGVKQNISLVNVHTRSNGGGESAANPRYAMRKYDVNVLKDSLDQYYGNVPLILLGDFNEDLDETVADQSAPTVNTTETSFIDYINDSENYIPATISLSNAGLRTFISFENVIDHMIISNEMNDLWLVGSERVVIPFDLVQNYANTTSDHIPVKVRFEFNCNLEAGIIAGTAQVCAGNEVQLALISGVYDEILGWESSSDNGATWINVDNSKGMGLLTLQGIESDQLYRVVLGSEICESIRTAPFAVSIKSLPKPVIFFEKGRVVTIEGAYTYKWYKNGNLFATSTIANEKFNGAGMYQVAIEDAEGCVSISDEVRLPITGPKANVNVFPNPASKVVNVSIKGERGLTNVQLLTMGGHQLAQVLSSSGDVEFDVSSFAKGVYLVMITDRFGNTTVERLLIK
ncbi:chitobiase/beta-hexosaminidase C-terminal domain-containing protein [Rhodonellum sp.]|uniref:chitobiase/beta-hexosaminidase C-terminal domain-containing protein n=1 Tax=Rhodonellum sp. TaxID=2231180 RepID=UPI00272323F1|nr:chitobiase/beta-hexosaminidase C-terminal domain-containing protein [Rhodonellum sp.]MDO9554448.1 chitobiase/beta-hexosaminidase C-terminal domain-containing protein [Rhodonellum sp.]